MKAISVRRSLRMGCGESLGHRAVRAFGLAEDRIGAMVVTDVQRLGWSNPPRGRVPEPADDGKLK